MTIEKKRIIDIANNYKNKNILVIGDVMLDSYMWGEVNRISPEAPIPVVSVSKTEYRLGGAANVAMNVKSLGANPILCSILGDDKYADIFTAKLKEIGLIDFGIVVEENRKTSVKTRIISKGQHLLRVDEEDTFPLSNLSENTLMQRIKDLIDTKNITSIIFEDYDKGVLSKQIIENCINYAKTYNISICVDPKRNNFFNYKNIDIFKPNFKEFCEGLKIDLNNTDFEKIANVGKLFIKENNIRILLITLSEKGIIIMNENAWQHYPAEIRDISDVSGAGDTVISVTNMCLCADATTEEIAQISNLAGGLVCEKTGVVPIVLDELINDINY